MLMLDENGNPIPAKEEVDETTEDDIDDVIENEDEDTPADGEDDIDLSKVDVKALIAQLQEKDKLLKTTSAQKEHFKNKYKGIIDAVKGNKNPEIKDNIKVDTVAELQKSMEIDLFLTRHPEFDESDVKVFQKFREPGQKLDQVLTNEVVKAYVDKKLSDAAHNNSIPSFGTRSPMVSKESAASKQFKTNLLNALPKATRDLIEKNKKK